MRLKKSLGQFLLTDDAVAQFMTEALPPNKLIVEIGPGTGALTSALLNAGRRVVAVEIDEAMVKRLERLGSRRDYRVIKGNILKSDWRSLAGGESEIVVTGNLPYHLTSPILFGIFHQVRSGGRPHIIEMTAMVQREVAERLTASPGGRNYGALTLLTRYHGVAEYLQTVPADRFHPKPSVDGGIFRLRLRTINQFPPVEYELFRRVVRGCFAQRRKMMRNSVRVIGDLPTGWRQLPFDFTRRPEEFDFDEFVQLTQALFPQAG